MKFFILSITLLLSSQLATAQDYFARKGKIDHFHRQIQNGVSWADLYDIVKTDSVLMRLRMVKDIEQTIKFEQKNIIAPHIIDSFFIKICSESYNRFPYRTSGHMDHIQKRYESFNPNIRNHESNLFNTKYLNEKSIYPLIFEIMDLERDESIPILIKYLSNNSATRCVITPRGWDNMYYLSVSDMAMELIELITLCDFYNNSAHPEQLFSNWSQKVKNEHISLIIKWQRNTQNLDKTESALVYLDSINIFESSYLFTCNNLLSLGDSLIAKNRYTLIYDAKSKPCYKDHKVGKKLKLLGNDILKEDCLVDIYNFRCSTSNGRECILHLLGSVQSEYDFWVIADIVSIERYSRSKRRQGKYIWPHIFNSMARTKNKWSEPVLVELMSIKKVVKNSKINSHYWKHEYPQEFENNFRVCDFALIKFIELFPKAGIIVNWNQISSRDNAIKQIQEIDRKKR